MVRNKQQYLQRNESVQIPPLNRETNCRGLPVTLIIALVIALIIGACGGDDSTIGGDDDDNGNGGAEPGGDTSGYSGVLTWRFGDGGEGSGIRLWQLQDSDFKLTVDEGEQGGEHKAPLVTSDERILVYTVDPVTFSDGEWSQVQWLDMEAGDLRSLPRDLSSQSVRASFGADVDQFGSTVSFAERAHADNQNEVQRYGAGVWMVGTEQAQSLVESEDPIQCTRMDPNANFIVFDQPGEFYRVNTGGGSPQRVNINHPALLDIQVDRESSGRCSYDLSDNGNRLAFTGLVASDNESVDGKPAAFFVDLDTGQTTRVAESTDGVLVDWKMAANGGVAVLLFLVGDDAETVEYAVHMVNLINPGVSTEIDSFSLYEEDPIAPEVAISANGQVLARSGYDDDGIHIKVMNADGLEQRRIQGDAATMGDGVLGLRF